MNKDAIREELMRRLWENKEYKKEDTPFGDTSSAEYRGLKDQICEYFDFLQELQLKDYIPKTGITEADYIDFGVKYINRIHCYLGNHSCREIISYLKKDEIDKLAVCFNFLFNHNLRECSALSIEKSIFEGVQLDKEHGEKIVYIHNCLEGHTPPNFLERLNLVTFEFNQCIKRIKDDFEKKGIVDPVAIETVFIYFECIVRLVLQELERIKPSPTDDIMTPIKNNIFSFEKEFIDELSKYKKLVDKVNKTKNFEHLLEMNICMTLAFRLREKKYNIIENTHQELIRENSSNPDIYAMPDFQKEYTKGCGKKKTPKYFFTEGKNIRDFDIRMEKARSTLRFLLNNNESCIDNLLLKAMFRELYFSKVKFNGKTAITIANDLYKKIPVSPREKEFLNDKLERGVFREQSKQNIYPEYISIIDKISYYLTQSYISIAPSSIMDLTDLVLRKFINSVWSVYYNFPNQANTQKQKRCLN